MTSMPAGHQTTRGRFAAAAWLLIALLTGHAAGAQAVDGEPCRWAVIINPRLADSPWQDALAAALAERGVELVERGAMDEVADELTLTAFQDDTLEGRLKLGEMVGADRLALVDRPVEFARDASDDEPVRVTVVDVATGLRLGMHAARPVGDPKALALLADGVVGVGERFPRGVEHVIAVTPWLSDNLNRDVDHLQTGLATVLIESLERHPGVAVVAIESARQLAGERELIGGPARDRLAPLVVQGKFTLQPVRPDQPRRVDLSMRVTRLGDGDLEPWRLEDVELDVVGRAVSRDAYAAVRDALTTETPLLDPDPDAEFVVLTKRADRFSEIGMPSEAATLREAALLTTPDHTLADDTRLRLAWDYLRCLHKGVTNPPTAENTREKLAVWRRALWHIEYLIVNRRIDHWDAFVISKAALSAPRSSRRLNDATAPLLSEADADRRRFVRDVLPRGYLLPPPDDDSPNRDRSPHVFASLALNSSVEPIFGRATEADWKLFAELLTRRLPADSRVDGQVFYYISAGGPAPHRDQSEKPADATHFGGEHAPDADPPITAEQWAAIMQDLASQSKEDCPWAWSVGEFALLSRAKAGKSPHSATADSLLTRTEEVERLLDTLVDTNRTHTTNLHRMAESLREHWQREQQTKRPAAQPAAYQPALPLEPATIAGGLTPLKLQRLHDDSEYPLPLGLFDILPVNDDETPLLNIWVGLNEVAFERRPGVFETVISVMQHSNRITSASWDGRYAWIANCYEGIYLLDASGEEVVRFDDDAGLPAASWTLLVQPIGPGRAIAAGTDREDFRSWIAELTLDADGRPVVKVLHRAMKKNMPYGQKGLSDWRADPEATCRLDYIWLWDRGDKGRHVVIGRDRFSPLVLDLENHRVQSIGPLPFGDDRGFNPFWGSEPHRHSFLPIDGPDGETTDLLFSAGNYGVELLRASGGLVGPDLRFERIDRWSTTDSMYMGNVSRGRLIECGPNDFIFAGPGGVGWGRIAVDLSGESPKLAVEPISEPKLRGLSHKGTAPAAHHGVVIWGRTADPLTVLRVELE